MICLVKIKLLDLDENYSVRGETLRKAMQEDVEKGLIPFYVSFSSFFLKFFVKILTYSN
jgi:aromatic-L-amino-acid decarboxylase